MGSGLAVDPTTRSQVSDIKVCLIVVLDHGEHAPGFLGGI
jgi:hypothetical protein